MCEVRRYIFLTTPRAVLSFLSSYNPLYNNRLYKFFAANELQLPFYSRFERLSALLYSVRVLRAFLVKRRSGWLERGLLAVFGASSTIIFERGIFILENEMLFGKNTFWSLLKSALDLS